MSIHRSLHVKSTLLRQRNVWTRLERIEKLEEDGKREPREGSVVGLPKVRTAFKIKTHKGKKADEEPGKEKAAEE